MKKHFGWLCVIGFLALSFGIIWEGYTESYADLPTSQQQQTPNFELIDLEGNTINLKDTLGKIRIVDFWATWCPPCRAEIPHFNALVAKYPDLVILGVALDQEGPEVVKSFAKEFDIQYPILMGTTQAIKAFGKIESIPTTFVIDQDGLIIKKYVGYRSQSVFESDIQALLKTDS